MLDIDRAVELSGNGTAVAARLLDPPSNHRAIATQGGKGESCRVDLLDIDRAIELSGNNTAVAARVTVPQVTTEPSLRKAAKAPFVE